MEMQCIKQGLRQGCVLSPDLFSKRDLEGIKVGEENLNCIWYADDTGLIADSKKKLHLLIYLLLETSEQKGLKLSASKTKVMVILKPNENVRVIIRLKGEDMEQIETFKYLGSYVTRDVTNTAISLTLRKWFLTTCTGCLLMIVHFETSISQTKFHQMLWKLCFPVPLILEFLIYTIHFNEKINSRRYEEFE